MSRAAVLYSVSTFHKRCKNRNAQKLHGKKKSHYIDNSTERVSQRGYITLYHLLVSIRFCSDTTKFSCVYKEIEKIKILVSN